MDANPTEVFTFIFTNPERVSPKDVWDPIFQQSGIASLIYTPPQSPMNASAWPTLGEMIDSGQRLVVFSKPDLVLVELKFAKGIFYSGLWY
jgi:hypothetical protein